MYRDCKTGGGMLHDVPARSGSQLQPGSGCNSMNPGPHSIHRVDCIEYRPHGSQLQPVPVCVDGACNLAPWITTATRPAFDPSSGLHRVTARSGSQLQPGSGCVDVSVPHFVRRIAERLRTFPWFDRNKPPDPNGNTARSGSQLQPGPVRVARCTAIAKPVAMCAITYPQR
jgi:hypothetical protein